MTRLPVLLASLLLTFSLAGCYTKFFADDDPYLSRYTRNAETQVDTIEESNGDLTVIIQEYFAPQPHFRSSLFWDAWGYDPFWSDPWFDRFFASPWFSVGFGWRSPYWAWNGWDWNPYWAWNGWGWHPYWGWNGGWGWNSYWAWNGAWGWNPRWGWVNPVGPWVQVPIVVAPVTPNDGALRNFGRIRYSSLLPNAVTPVSPAVTPVASPESDARRASSESALDKRNAVRRTVNQGYYSLPWMNSAGASSERRQSSSSGYGSTVSSGSSGSSGSGSSSSSSSGTRASGRTR